MDVESMIGELERAEVVMDSLYQRIYQALRLVQIPDEAPDGTAWTEEPMLFLDLTWMNEQFGRIEVGLELQVSPIQDPWLQAYASIAADIRIWAGQEFGDQDHVVELSDRWTKGGHWKIITVFAYVHSE